VSRVILDTNVPVCANGMTPQASPACQLACVNAVEDVTLGKRGVLLLDSLGHILAEYQSYLSRRGQPGVGDAFFKWLVDNQANRTRVVTVAIAPDANRDYAEFPDDPALAAFDRSDRKFVAVALGAPGRRNRRPPILNATDSDWGNFAAELTAHGIVVQELCP
jgi:hypothetical protein